MPKQKKRGLSSDITGHNNWRYSMRTFNPRAAAVSNRFSRRLAPRSAYVGINEGVTDVPSSAAQQEIAADPISRWSDDVLKDNRMGGGSGGKAQDKSAQQEAAGLESPINQDFMSPGLEHDVLGDVLGRSFTGAAKDTASSMVQAGAMAREMGASYSDIASGLAQSAPGMMGATLAGPGSTMGAMARGFLSIGDLSAAQQTGTDLQDEMKDFESAPYDEYGSPAQRQAGLKSAVRSEYQRAKSQPTMVRLGRALGALKPSPKQARAMHEDAMVESVMSISPAASQAYNTAIRNGMTHEEAMHAARFAAATDIGLGGDADYGQDLDTGPGGVFDATSPNPADRGYESPLDYDGGTQDDSGGFNDRGYDFGWDNPT